MSQEWTRQPSVLMIGMIEGNVTWPLSHLRPLHHYSRLRWQIDLSLRTLVQGVSEQLIYVRNEMKKRDHSVNIRYWTHWTSVIFRSSWTRFRSLFWTRCTTMQYTSELIHDEVQGKSRSTVTRQYYSVGHLKAALLHSLIPWDSDKILEIYNRNPHEIRRFLHFRLSPS